MVLFYYNLPDHRKYELQTIPDHGAPKFGDTDGTSLSKDSPVRKFVCKSKRRLIGRLVHYSSFSIDLH